jgi:DNA-binding response OmpR family regulator
MLVVEDDPTIGALLESGLRAGQHEVRWARTGTQALAEAARRPPQVVLLDLGLPDQDGIQLCRMLRSRHPNALIIILTARREPMDVVLGLDAGADDYLTKPFTLVELLARLRAHLRRWDPDPDDAPLRVECGPLRLDLTARRCVIAGHEIELRMKEFDLIARLAQPAGRAVSRQTLMTDVWDPHWFGSTKTLDVTMASLRRKLEAGAAAAGCEQAPVITTIRGHGFRLERPL